MKRTLKPDWLPWRVRNRAVFLRSISSVWLLGYLAATLERVLPSSWSLVAASQLLNNVASARLRLWQTSTSQLQQLCHHNSQSVLLFSWCVLTLQPLTQHEWRIRQGSRSFSLSLRLCPLLGLLNLYLAGILATQLIFFYVTVALWQHIKLWKSTCLDTTNDPSSCLLVLQSSCITASCFTVKVFSTGYSPETRPV